MSNKKLAIVGAIFVLILMVGINQDGHVSKSKDQIEYETWLHKEEVTQRAGSSSTELPVIALKIFPISSTQLERDIKITSTNIPDGKERVLRLLQLIREAGLLDFKNEIGTDKPGDIVLGIESSEKKFSVKFSETQIKSNVKAALLLKLMQEYDKQKIPDALQFTKKETLPLEMKDPLTGIPEELRGKDTQEVIPLTENPVQ